MEITLKNLKINKAFSKETICFMADVYVDGVKCGYAENDGNGGSTNIGSYIDKHDLFNNAVVFCKNLPTKPMDLEFFIGGLVDAELSCKKIKADCAKGICYGTKQQYNIVFWKKFSIAKMMESPNGRVVLTKKINELKAKGETILNTNLNF